MRPRSLDDYVGQKHLVGKDAVLRKMIEGGRISSFILWGPPGVGKTTLAQIIAHKLDTPFYTLSAVTSGVKDVREVIEKAKNNRFFNSASPILFIDEIHRFSKSQQDSLLGAVERGIVTEAAFVSEYMMEGKPAVYLQTHTGNETRRTIRNEWFRVTDGVSGAPVFEALQAPPGTAESITVEGSPPWFALFSPAAVKNLDGGTGLGMSVFAEALAEAQGIDLAFDNYREDIRLGHKKIFYSADICRKVVDQEGVEHSIPPDDDVQSQFVTLPQKEGSLDQSSEYHEYNPDLRVEQNHKAVQDMLNLFSFKCGLGCHRYNFELGNVTTATEYNGSRQDLVASANKNQIPIEGALVGIVRAILWAAKNLQGAAVDLDTPISVDWDDSYITDAETRMSQMRDDALSGLLPRYKYLSARYGVSEEDARKLAQEAADENKQPELSFGGGG